MKTRRSKKSFEMPPPPRRRNRKSMKGRRKAQNVVNETIVLSDSDQDENEVQVVNDDDIQVIDVAEASDITTTEIEPVQSSSGGESRVALKSEEAVEEPPVIDIEDETDQKDDLEVVAVIVTSSSKKRLSRRELPLRSSLKRKSSNGNLLYMQESIKKAKNHARRNSAIASKISDIVSQPLIPLNRISANSRQISRRNNNKKRKNRHQMGGGNFQFRNRNGLFHNRAREYNREIIFRPGTLQQPNINFAVDPLNNFSFEDNPFIPRNTSTPAPAPVDTRSAWMPIRRHRQAPASIAPGSNIMNAGEVVEPTKGSLRPIVIDGSNVAVGHAGVLYSDTKLFSARGIKICVEYFKRRGHTNIIAFVPRYRLKKSESIDPELLEEMEREGNVRFTPSREAGGQRIVSYDDLYVVEYAHNTGGVIISNDNFRDLYDKKQHLQDTITLRLLQYTWITPDYIMFPEDPLGRKGPSLDEFLRF